MINSIKYLNNGWTLINSTVKVRFNIKEQKIDAQFNKNIIQEMDALNLIEEFIKISKERLIKNYSTSP